MYNTFVYTYVYTFVECWENKQCTLHVINTLPCVRVHYHTGNKCRVKESGEEKAEVRRVPALTFATKLDHAGDHLITRETCPTMMLNNLRLLIRAPPLPTLCRPVMFAKEVLWWSRDAPPRFERVSATSSTERLWRLNIHLRSSSCFCCTNISFFER